VCDINGDGVEEVIYCTDNEDFIIANVKGEHILTVEDFPHPQKVSIGKFMRDVPGKQLFMNNRATHGGAVMLDANGKILWDLPLNGYAQTLSGAGEDGLDLILFSPAPGRCPEALQEKLKVRAAELGYENLPISGNAGFEKLVIDGYGRILAKLPKVCDSIDVTKWGIPQHLKVDYGAGNELNILDLDGDGKLEYVFSDRWNLYIVK